MNLVSAMREIADKLHDEGDEEQSRDLYRAASIVEAYEEREEESNVND